MMRNAKIILLVFIGVLLELRLRLREYIKIIHLHNCSKYVIKIQDFSLLTPGTGASINMKERFSFNVIAAQEEHNREQKLSAMSNFALLREALGYTARHDYTMLRSDHTKIISACTEIICCRLHMSKPLRRGDRNRNRAVQVLLSRAEIYFGRFTIGSLVAFFC